MTRNVDPLAAIEAAMVAIRRRQTRRALARQAGAAAPHAAVIDVVEAGGDVTVGAVAEALAVDQPRASRLVAAAVGAGLVRREADQADGRRALLRLTARGRRHAREMHRHRQEAFAAAMAGWSAAERAEFAWLLTRFVGVLDGPAAGGE